MLKNGICQVNSWKNSFHESRDLRFLFWRLFWSKRKGVKWKFSLVGFSKENFSFSYSPRELMINLTPMPSFCRGSVKNPVFVFMWWKKTRKWGKKTIFVKPNLSVLLLTSLFLCPVFPFEFFGILEKKYFLFCGEKKKLKHWNFIISTESLFLSKRISPLKITIHSLPLIDYLQRRYLVLLLVYSAFLFFYRRWLKVVLVLWLINYCKYIPIPLLSRAIFRSWTGAKFHSCQILVRVQKFWWGVSS